MASKVLCLALIAAASAVAPPAYGPAPEVYPDAAPVYSYQYGVADDYSKAAFSQQESRDGYATSGEYRVNLPDGRVQIVSYTAGPEGYVADVKYEGEAAYPEAAPYKPAPYKAAPAPAYKAAPAPAYKPAVVHAPAYHKPAPVYHKPAPVYHKPAPVYHAAPAYHKPAPAYHAAPAYHKPAAYAPKRKYSYTVITEAPAAAVVEEVAEVAEAAPVEEAAPAYTPAE